MNYPQITQITQIGRQKAEGSKQTKDKNLSA